MRKVVLELTEDEARTLYVVTGVFNGSPSNSPRKHTEAIYNNLFGYFRKRSYDMPERELLPVQCELMFRNYPVTKTPQQLKIEELEKTINEAQKQLEELKGL